MKVLVTGDRYWTAKHIIMQVLEQMKPRLVIEGGARGADALARDCAMMLRIPVSTYQAEWSKYGFAAGPKRNTQMLVQGKPDIVLAFHDNLEKSKGTRGMIYIANQHGVIVNLYRSNGEVCGNYFIL